MALEPTGADLDGFTVEMISAAKRKALPEGQFALPDKRAYPIDTAARVRNAAARLEQNKGSLSPAEYAQAKKRVAAAAKKFGVDSMYAKKASMDLGVEDVHAPSASGGLKGKRRGLQMRLGLPGGHSIEVVHNSESDGSTLLRCTSVALSAESAGADDAAKPVWVQIAKPGHFEGHSAGAFSLDSKVFADIVRNFREVDQRRVFFDFEHASEEDPSQGSIPQNGAPAQGRILELDSRADGLWGLVEWFEPARQYIREGRYTSLSPAIRFNARHPVTGAPIGARLTSVALTNRPFLRGLAPLAARDGAAKVSVYSTQEMMPRLRQALGMSPLASAAECKTELGRLRAMYECTDDPRATVQGVNMSVYTDALMGLGHVPMNSTLGDLLDAVEAIVDRAIAEHNLERHDGAEEDEDDEFAGMADHDTEGAAMSDQEMTAKLKDAETKAADLEAKLKDAEAKTAELTLKLKDSEAGKADAVARITALEQAESKRADEARTSRVAEAFDTYKDQKRLTDADRDMMAVYLRSNPDGFEKLYPRVTADRRYLMRDLTVAGADRPASPNAAAQAQPGNGAPPAGGAELPTIEELVAKYTDKGMPLDQACIKADAKLRKLRAQRANTLV